MNDLQHDVPVTMEQTAAAVLAAAHSRAAALTAADRDRLTALLHPDLRWTTHRGTVLDREQYLAANVGGSLTWLDQRLENPEILLAGDRAAVLTALVVDLVRRDGGEPETFRMRLTQTWVHDDATGWRCLAGHAGPSV